MDEIFNIKNLQFSENDLDFIQLNDLANEMISPGHIVVRSRVNGKPFIILRAGDFIDDYFIEKYATAGISSFYQLKIVNRDQEEKIKYKISELMSNKINEWERNNRNVEFLKEVQKFFKNSQESQYSVLNLLRAMNAKYNCIPLNIFEKNSTISSLIYQRNLMISTLMVIFGTLLGISDLKLLKDLYNLGQLLDISLLKSGYNTFIEEALKLSYHQSKDALVYLKKNKVHPEVYRTFFYHPVKSYQLATQFVHHFNYPEVLELIKFHHEELDGTGFPQGISYQELGHIDQITHLCQQLVPYEEIIFSHHQEKNPFHAIEERLSILKKANPNSMFFKLAEKKWKWFLELTIPKEGITLDQAPTNNPLALGKINP